MKSERLSPSVRASYELLGCELGATPAELKKAYHRLALLYHPDRNSAADAARDFQRITEAFDLLTSQDRVVELNQAHARGQRRDHLRQAVLSDVDLPDLQITFGSFFGYRYFDPRRHLRPDAAPERLRLTGKGARSGEVSTAVDEVINWDLREESQSVLDHPAFDAIEAVFAGRLQVDDEDRIAGELRPSELQKLPWVVLNNQGILCYLDGDIKGARKAYEELCRRVPGNILFQYRLGLCLIIQGFQQPTRNLMGRRKPNRRQIDQGVRLLRHCLDLGQARQVGRQRCLVIRKTLADVLAAMGRSRQARKLWREIQGHDPKSVEAVFHLEGAAAARESLRRLARRKTAASSLSLKRLPEGRGHERG